MSPRPARLLVLLLLALPCSVQARTVVVDTTADDPALTACDDAAPSDCSLRGAILAANERPPSETTTIDVPAGTYVLSQSSSCAFQRHGSPSAVESSAVPLCIAKNVILQGAGAATTVIDGNLAHRVLMVSAAATAEVRGVTITRGLSDQSFGVTQNGGGIENDGNLTLSNSVVSASALDPIAGAASGAGIYNVGQLTLLQSVVTDNVSPLNDLGGGIFNGQQAILVLSDSTISGNVIGANGGGLCNSEGSATITNSTVSGNAANGFGGGGIANFGGTFIATLVVTNSTISGNHSGSSGGGIITNARTTTHLNNVTITDNTGAMDARGSGGGVSGTFILQNTVLGGNHDATTATTPDCGTGTQLLSQGHNLIQDPSGCVISGDSTGNLIAVDPKLGVLTDNGGFTRTHGLGTDSPAIGAGNPAAPGSGGAACAASDQRGLLRPVGTACDIGAFERGSAFSLARILPDTGGSDGSLTVLVSGGGFAPAATVALRRAGHADIVGNPVATDVAGAALTTTFDLTGADVGSWDVVVTNPDLTSVALAGGFTIEAPRAADLYAIVVARSSARPGLPARIAVLYGNRGNTDARGVPLTLRLPASFARRFSLEVAAPPAQPGQPYNDYGDVPLELKADVASDQVDVPLLIPIVPAGFTGVLAFSLTPPAGTAGEEFAVEAHFGTPWFANGTVLPDVVAEAATRARQFAADRLGVTAGPELDPTLVAYETAALDLAVASSRDDLVGNFGQIRRVFSLPYFAIDLAGYAAAQVMAGGAPTPLGRLAAFRHGLVLTFGLIASPAEAQMICDCVCGQPPGPGCTCKDRDCTPPDPGDGKKPPKGLGPGECDNLPHHKPSADGKTCIPDGSQKCAIISTDPDCLRIPIRNSADPNDKAGSGGSGSERFVPSGTPMPYMIAFENLPAATAPAQTVVVTDQLDTGVLDLDSFSLGPILIGDVGITPAPGLTTFSGGADLRPAHNVVVRVDAGLDKATGIVTWSFTSLDPTTLETLMDPDEGFLPPNIDPPAGDAQVHFTILPKAGLATGTAIRNHARVVFDTNAPIDTPEWLNTVDASAPTSQVRPLASTQPSASFLVEWAGTDDGAGILDYSIFVSVDGGPFMSFLTNTAETSATFSGELGKTYAFYSVARDLAGNVEDAPAVADALTALTAGRTETPTPTPPVPTPTLSRCIGDCNRDGEVKVNELITGVSIALDRAPISECPSFDESGNDHVEVSELVRGVNNLLTGCTSQELASRRL